MASAAESISRSVKIQIVESCHNLLLAELGLISKKKLYRNIIVWESGFDKTIISLFIVTVFVDKNFGNLFFKFFKEFEGRFVCICMGCQKHSTTSRANSAKFRTSSLNITDPQGQV